MPTWLEVILRTFSAVVVLFLLTKLLGKRQISQLSLFEYITGITIGSLAAYISLELDGAWHLGILSLVVWVAVSLGIEFIQLKSKTARRWIDGQSTVVIQQGKILEDQLKKERLTSDELLEQLRKKNVFQVADVEFAVMEPSGDINVLLKKEHRPLTPKQVGVKVESDHEPKTVIMDGEVLSHELAASGFSQKWLSTELEKQNVQLHEVFLGQIDHLGQLHVDLYDDQIKAPEANQPKLLWATLRKCQADLELFSLSTKDPEAKKLYQNCSQRMKKVIQETKPYLE